MRRYLKGQAMVLVLVFLTVLMLSLLAFFNISQVSRSKVEVQNAADAVAYSAAVLEARHLNFTAYTNRAMIANEVGIAQTIGLTSWLVKWSNTFPNLAWWLDKIISPIPVVGPPLAAVIKVAFKIVGDAIGEVAEFMAEFSAAFASLVAILDPYYGYAQLAFRFATYDSIIAAGLELPEQNAPGSRMATLAYIYAMYNLYMYEKYNVSYKPAGAIKRGATSNTKAINKEGMRRFAAAVNDSRDGWSSDRHNDELLLDEEDTWRIKIPIIGSFKFGYKVVVGLQGEGASALRFISNRGKDYYNWSSMDTEEFKFALGIWLFDIYTGIPPDPGLVIPIPMGWGTAQMAHKPGGAGLSAAVKKLTDAPTTTKGWKSVDAYGRTWWDSLAGDLDERGNSVSSYIASLGKNTPYSGDSTTIVKETYGDLPPYHDINPKMDIPPPFVVWIHQPKDNIHTSDNMSRGANTMTTTGKLALDNPMIEEMAGGGSAGIQAIASGEIYYKRTDGADEPPNVFSPYWHARLAPISSNELFVVMASQNIRLAWAFTGISQSANSLYTQITGKADELWADFEDGRDVLSEYLP